MTCDIFYFYVNMPRNVYPLKCLCKFTEENESSDKIVSKSTTKICTTVKRARKKKVPNFINDTKLSNILEAIKLNPEIIKELHEKIVNKTMPNKKINKTNVSKSANSHLANDDTKSCKINAEQMINFKITKNNSERKVTSENGIVNSQVTHENSKMSIVEDYLPLSPKASTEASNVSDAFSWTKDISSSSCMTITATYSDIVRIDGKIPVVELTNINSNKYLRKKARSLSSKRLTATSTSVENKHSDKDNDDELNLNRLSIPPLCLSEPSDIERRYRSPSNITSLSSRKSVDESIFDNFDSFNNINNLLDDLKCELDKSDNDILYWFKEDEKSVIDNTKLNELTLKKCKNELILINICNGIENSLDEYSSHSNKDTENDGISNDIPNDESFDRSYSQSAIINSNITKDSDHITDKEHNKNEKDVTRNRSQLTTDDDDAISLYADSITGMESLQISHNNHNDDTLEEYIPKPVANSSAHSEHFEYTPSRIDDQDDYFDNQDENNLNTPAEEIDFSENVEINNFASDTSSPIGSPVTGLSIEPVEAPQNFIVTKTRHNKCSPQPLITKASQRMECNKLFPDDTHINKTQITTISQYKNNLLSQPQLIHTYLKPVTGINSIIFRGVCFYNLISNCKKFKCNFGHYKPPVKEIKNILIKIEDTDTLLKEYLLVRNYPQLRMTYTEAFLEIFIERQLTRVLLDMSLDYIMKTNISTLEENLRKYIIESVLLHLNKIDLRCHCNYLQYDTGSGLILCEAFIQQITNSQNFSRFKPVFISLTNFMIGLNRRFDLTLANSILERLCIFFRDEELSLALLMVVRNTDEGIFDNPKLAHFESNLRSSNEQLFRKFDHARRMMTASKLRTSPNFLAFEPSCSFERRPYPTMQIANTKVGRINLSKNPIRRHIKNDLVNGHRPNFSTVPKQPFSLTRKSIFDKINFAGPPSHKLPRRF